MKIFKETLDKRDQIIVENNQSKFIISWFAADLYWIMLDYTPQNSFIVTKDTPYLWDFFVSLFSKYHFKNNTFIWISEARLEAESSTLKITKGKDYFRIRFIQGKNDFLAKARNICPVCFCLSGSKNQEIANEFSILLHTIFKQRQV